MLLLAPWQRMFIVHCTFSPHEGLINVELFYNLDTAVDYVMNQLRQFESLGGSYTTTGQDLDLVGTVRRIDADGDESMNEALKTMK